MAWRLTKVHLRGASRSLDSSEWPQTRKRCRVDGVKAPQNSLVDVRTGDAIENHVRKLEDGQVDDVLPDDTEDRDAVRSRRPVVWRRLHFFNTTRVHLTMTWVVSFLLKRPFGPI